MDQTGLRMAWVDIVDDEVPGHFDASFSLLTRAVRRRDSERVNKERVGIAGSRDSRTGNEGNPTVWTECGKGKEINKT